MTGRDMENKKQYERICFSPLFTHSLAYHTHTQHTQTNISTHFVLSVSRIKNKTLTEHQPNCTNRSFIWFCYELRLLCSLYCVISYFPYHRPEWLFVNNNRRLHQTQFVFFRSFHSYFFVLFLFSLHFFFIDYIFVCSYDIQLSTVCAWHTER